RSVTGPARVLAAAAMAFAAAGVYASCIEPFRLQVERAEVRLPGRTLPASGLRLGVISDVHAIGVTDHERAAVDRLLAGALGAVLGAAGLWRGGPADLELELPALRELFSRLSAPGGVFVVPGNWDAPADLRRIFEGTRVRLLENETAAARVGEAEVLVGG